MTSVAAPERQLVSPAHLNIPDRVSSGVAEVVDFSAAMGRVFDEEQTLAADVLMSEREGGLPATLEGGLVCSRQNLKTFVFECIAGTLLFIGEADLIIWSAQMFDTAQESFRNFDELVTNYDHLRQRVKTIHRGNGEEAIELTDGARLKFKARSRTGGRGLTGDVVVLDEAFALQPAHMGALIPTLSTRPRARVLYGSSAGMVDSSILRGVRDRGRRGGYMAPAYLEWSSPLGKCRAEKCQHVPETPGCLLDDESRWQQANPAMGRRISVEFIRSERLALPPEEFARERLGWWDDPAGEVPIRLDDWDGCGDPSSAITSSVVLAVDASPGLRSAAVAALGWRADGKAHGEVIQHRSGTDWLPAYLKEVADRQHPASVVAAANGPIRAVVPDIEKAGVTVDTMSDADGAAACVALEREVKDRAFRHLADPLLRAALEGAARKDVGDGGWMLVRKSSDTDICPLVALTLGRRGLASVPPPSVPLVAWGR